MWSNSTRLWHRLAAGMLATCYTVEVNATAWTLGGKIMMTGKIGKAGDFVAWKCAINQGKTGLKDGVDGHVF